MKKILIICLAAFTSVAGFSQKEEAVSIDCGGNTIAFKGIRLGDAPAEKHGTTEYFYTFENKKVTFYQLNGYKGEISSVKKYIITIGERLINAKFDAPDRINLTNLGSGEEGIKEDCDCKSGKVETEKNSTMLWYVFYLDAKQKADFEAVLAKMTATAAEMQKK